MARTREFDREDVLNRALLLFMQQGYEATSVRDLVGAMDISTSSMYEFFGDKRSIFIEVLKRSCAYEQAAMLQKAAQAESPRVFVASMFDNLDAPDAPMKGSLALNTMVEFGTRDAEITQCLLDHYFKIAEIVARVLSEAQAAGQIPASIDPPALTHTILSTVYGVATIYGVKPDFVYRPAVKDVILTLLD